MTRNRTLLLLAALACTLSILALDRDEHAERAAAPARAGHATSGEGFRPDADSRSSRPFTPGDVVRYRFEVEQDFRLIGLMKAPGAPEEVTLRKDRRGTMILRVHEARADGWTVSVRLEDLRFSRCVHGRGTTDERDLVGELRGEVLAHLRACGRFSELRFPRDTGNRARLAWKALLAHWSFEAGAGASWETIEDDATGSYRAVYSRDGRDILKRKVEYTELRGTGATGAAVEGLARITLDPLPVRVEGRESSKIEMGAGDRRIEGEISFLFVRTSLKREAVQARRLEGERTTLAERDGRVDHEKVERRTRDKLGQLEQLFAAGRRRTSDANRAMLWLIQYVRLSDRAVAAVSERMESAACTDEMVTALCSVLGAGGTPAAQQCLIQALNDARWSPRRRRAVLFSLAEIEKPVVDLDPALERLIDASDERDTALLMWAAVGSKLRDSDPVRYARIRTALKSKLRSCDARLAQDVLANLRQDRA